MTRPDGEPWTIRRVLRWTTDFFKEKGIDTARLDAELLVADGLGLQRIGLYLDPDRPLIEPELAAIRERVRRRARREPVAYILGRRGFRDLELRVDARVLIPRPETEELVERALALLQGREAPVVVDVGVGSGAIALAIAKARPDARVVGTDASAGAVEVAAANAAANDLGRVELHVGDLLAPVAGMRADLVVSNPPYIATGDLAGLMADVVGWEPRSALDGGPDGLDVVRRLVADAAGVVVSGGGLLVEIGDGQGDAARDIVAADPRWVGPRIHPDYAGRQRILEARRA